MKIPEPERATFLCPHCNVVSLHFRSGQAPDYNQTVELRGKDGKDHTTQVTMQHRIYRCVNCQKDTYFLISKEAKAWEFPPSETDFTPTLVAENPSEKIHQYPISTQSLHPSVNEDVKRATIEAENCFSVSAFNACGVMARRAMHCLCIDKGAEGKDLYEQLKYLRDNNLITPDLWEWAEELRIVGRSGAHPDWEEVTKEDAEYALNFLQEIIRYVYINPAEREARRLKETKKKKS